jgi:hypothetical protein
MNKHNVHFGQQNFVSFPQEKKPWGKRACMDVLSGMVSLDPFSPLKQWTQINIWKCCRITSYCNLWQLSCLWVTGSSFNMVLHQMLLNLCWIFCTLFSTVVQSHIYILTSTAVGTFSHSSAQTLIHGNCMKEKLFPVKPDNLMDLWAMTIQLC